MPRYHYGTLPVLAWIINHYFYRGVHYCWLAEEFHPGDPNPKSSDPYLIYKDLLEPWRKRDEWDRFVDGARRSLARGVREQRKAGMLDSRTATRLRGVCRRCRIDFFYPVVYRVDVDAIAEDRRLRRNSALRGSRELLITDLTESEFDLLFADDRDNPDFRALVLDAVEGVGVTPPALALTILERR